MLVLNTALIIGGSTLFGGLIGLCFKNASKKIIDDFLSFSFGIMIIVSIVGLILPTINYQNKISVFISIIAIFLGVFLVDISDIFLPYISKIFKITSNSKTFAKDIILILAIIVHNLPEGMASGLGYIKSQDLGFYIMLSIALQNIPEGLMVFLAMLNIEKNIKKAVLVTVITAFVEITGVFFGYYLVKIFQNFIDFFMALAGGAMLYAVANEILDSQSGGSKKMIYLMILGFCFMLIIDCFLN